MSPEVYHQMLMAVSLLKKGGKGNMNKGFSRSKDATVLGIPLLPSITIRLKLLWFQICLRIEECFPLYSR